MAHKIHDIGVSVRIGPYSDGIETAPNQRWLFTAGTPGMDKAGQLPPDITAQAELAWGNILKVLEKAGMTVHDLVKITQYLVKTEDIPAYAKVRARVLGDARPTSMMMVVAALPRPDFLLEIEAVAARA